MKTFIITTAWILGAIILFPIVAYLTDNTVEEVILEHDIEITTKRGAFGDANYVWVGDGEKGKWTYLNTGLLNYKAGVYTVKYKLQYRHNDGTTYAKVNILVLEINGKKPIAIDDARDLANSTFWGLVPMTKENVSSFKIEKHGNGAVIALYAK